MVQAFQNHNIVPWQIRNKWKNAINTLNMDTNLRKENSMSNRTMLQKKGYDVESNIRNELLPFYKRHLN